MHFAMNARRLVGRFVRNCGGQMGATSFWKRDFYLSLERAVGERAGEDKKLISSGQFHAYITPDLPESVGIDINTISEYSPPGMLNVRTVAAQVREEHELLELLVDQSALADALLLISGSDKRRNTGEEYWYDSTWLLEQAQYLKLEEEIPSWVELWAVANPMVEKTIQKLKYKISMGAEAIVTQPPLDWFRFKKWWDKVEKSKRCRKVRFIIGMPLITSAKNFSFWSKLCDCQGLPEMDAMLKRAGNLSGKEEKVFWRKWNVELMEKILRLRGVGGVHFMPIGQPAQDLGREILKYHLLPAIINIEEEEIQEEERPD